MTFVEAKLSLRFTEYSHSERDEGNYFFIFVLMFPCMTPKILSNIKNLIFNLNTYNIAVKRSNIA